jgi:hypothetical protein
LPFSLISLDVVDGAITAVRSLVNPDKHPHVGRRGTAQEHP